MNKEYYQKINKEEYLQAIRLGQILIKEFNPKTIVDVGTATGLYLKPFLLSGLNILGIEKNKEVLEVASIPKEFIKIYDISKKIEVKKKYDLLLCLEVLEHIKEELADNVITNLCKMSNTLIFSAAIPGQGGEGHINCQPKHYWIEKFKRNGFIINQEKTNKITTEIKKGYHLGWLPQNLIVLEKLETIKKVRAEKRAEKMNNNPNNSKQKRFHLLGLAHIETTDKGNALGCAYSQKVLKMAKMLKSLGHYVMFYGVEGSTVECDEFVQVSSQKILKVCYGDYNRSKKMYKHAPKDYASNTFNKNCIKEINKRKRPKDFLLIPFGNFQKPVADRVNIPLTVESGIGYSGVFAKYKVFESHTWMSWVYGFYHWENIKWYDCAIPNYWNPDDFEFKEKKQDYFLYLGRVIPRKGVEIAIETIRAIGGKLLLAGQLGEGVDYVNLNYPEIKHVGFAGLEKRKKLLSNAKALFLPTIYHEPFGGTTIESLFSGTPVITSDFGVFPETIPHGKVGYRCRTLDQFIWAARNINNIKPIDCYNYAMKNFTLDRVAQMYEEYFNQLLNLHKPKGWYFINNERKELDWLNKWYPPEEIKQKLNYPVHIYNKQPKSDITVTITSCARFDLLKRTINSLFKTIDLPVKLIILDDSENEEQHKLIINEYGKEFDIHILGKNMGQAKSLDYLYNLVKTKYVFQCEDDWEFLEKGYLEKSLTLLETFPKIGIIQLDLRKDYFNVDAVGKIDKLMDYCNKEKDINFYHYKTWRVSEKHDWWYGLCGSPSLRRIEDFRRIGKFASVKKESDYDKLYGKSGLKTVWLSKKYIHHLGYGRSLLTKTNYRWDGGKK